MNKKELELYVKKASENVFKKLAENPEEMLNLIDLQEKYNNLLKEKIELKRQIKNQKEVINKVKRYIHSVPYCNAEFETILDILKEVG